MRYITIHCADTPNGKEFHASDIDLWHKERKFNRTAEIAKTYNPTLKHIGYHFVICVDGRIETGRAVGEDGAHVAGHNKDNIGICLIGKNKFTLEQWLSLNKIINQLKSMYTTVVIKGHNEFDTAQIQGKTCPNFDVQKYLETNMIPDENLLGVRNVA